MRYGDVREEWRIGDIERKIDAAPKSHEIHALRSDVASLERTVQELRTDITELRVQLSTLQDYTIAQLQQDLRALQSAGDPS